MGTVPVNTRTRPAWSRHGSENSPQRTQMKTQKSQIYVVFVSSFEFFVVNYMVSPHRLIKPSQTPGIDTEPVE
jgi:hypothetical protein